MISAPVPFFLMRLMGLLSVALLVTGVWFVVDGLTEDGRSDAWIWTGAIMALLGLVGRLPISLLFRKSANPDRLTVMPQGRPERTHGAGGSDLQIETFGRESGPTVILTHGWGLDRTVWASAIKRLSMRYRVVAWDLPGLGASGRPLDEWWTLPRMARDLCSVIQTADGAPVVLVGHSIGGMITLQYCRDFPDALGAEVAGVAIVDSTPRMPLRTMTGAGLWTRLRDPFLKPLMKLETVISPLTWAMNWTAYLNGTAHLVVRLTGMGRSPSREAVELFTRLSVKHSPRVQAKGNLAMFGWDAPEVPATIPVPVLSISGSSDRVTLPEAGRSIAEGAPHGEYVEVEGVGHGGFLEEADVYEEALDGFVQAAFENHARMGEARHADVLARQPDTERLRPAPFDEDRSFERDDRGAPSSPPAVH